MSRAWLHGFGWLVGVITLVTLALVYSRESYPPMPAALTLEVTFPKAAVGRVEPILCTGLHDEGNLLVVRYTGEATAVFSYEHWGLPGLMSEPIAFQAGSRHVLRIEMPSLTTYAKPPPGAQAWLRVDFDGKPILHREVPYHARLPKEIFFGENPIGASVDWLFRGTLRTPDGRRLAGGPGSYFTHRERLLVWARTHAWQVVGVAIAALTVGVVAGVFAAACGKRRVLLRTNARPIDSVTHIAPNESAPADSFPELRSARRRSIAWFTTATLAASLGYAWLVTLGTFQFNYAEVFGSFYDHQAASLLQGRLDVPEEAIGPEAFEARGKLYGYFGPTPALLRMPFAIFGVGFGKLSRAFMLGYFVACLIAAYLVFCHALRVARRAAPLTEPGKPPSAFATLTLVGGVGFGSTIFFLGSRGLIFHEAILAGITFALWSAWCTLRHLDAPDRRWWIGALVCGILSVHARPTTGLFALAFLGCASVLTAVREIRAAGWMFPPTLRRHVSIGALCALGFLSLNGLAWLKFRTFDAAPLRISRPYTSQPGRLEHIGGKSLHLANLPFNFDAYVLRPNFRIERGFPWVYLGSKKPRRAFPNAKIDLPDFTLALPYSTPSLFLLATLGCLGAAFAFPSARVPITAIWLAALPMTLVLFAAVATAQRYTGDFCPFLICAGCFGLAAMESAAPRWRLVFRTAVALATLAAIGVTVALTLHYQGQELWGIPEERRVEYQALRRRVDAFFGVPSTAPLVPPPPRTDADF